MAIDPETIEREVSYFLGYGYNPVSNDTFIDNIANRAIRQFVIPSPIDGESSAHKWSWLTGTGVLPINAPVTFSHTSAAGYKLNDDVAGGETCPQVTAGVVNFGLETLANFPQWVFTHSSGDGSSGADQVAAMVKISGLGDADGYHIPTSYSYQGTDKFRANLADTSINVAEVGAGVSFTFYNVMKAADATFGAIDGSMKHDFNKGYSDIPVINIGAMRDLYAAKPITSTVPEYVAYDDDKDRFLFYPPPDDSYVLRYNYAKSSSQSHATMLGLIPDKYEGILINAALALAEVYADTPNKGQFLQMYTSQLKSAILEDRANHRSEYFGSNRDNSDEIYERGYRTDRADIYYTDRSGTKYPS